MNELLQINIFNIMRFTSISPFYDNAVINIPCDQTDEVQINFESTAIDVAFLSQNIEKRFKAKVLRLNREKIKSAFQIIGCKTTVASQLSERIFNHFLVNAQNNKIQNIVEVSEKIMMYTTKEKFLGILRKYLAEQSLTKEHNIFDFELALDLIEQKKSMIVLLGGTSGTGKSTVSSLLASRFGISTVLSTDSIRHILRNFMSTEESPVLFASTYEAGSKLQFQEELTEKKRTVMGFQQQAAMIQQRLEPVKNILEEFSRKGESVVIEGVHLTPDFMLNMLKKHNKCIPFLIYIKDEAKHRERFAVRSKHMTLDKKSNKYVQNFTGIRIIQKYLIKRADEYLIPKVDNANIDKSVGIVHRTIVRCLRRMSLNEYLYDEEKNNAFKIYENFNKVTKNVWSSEAVKHYISQKAPKGKRKNELILRMLGTDNSQVIQQKRTLEEEEIQDLDERDDSPRLRKDNYEEKDDKIEVNEVNETEIDVQVYAPSKKQSIAFKEDFFQETLPLPLSRKNSEKPKESIEINTESKSNLSKKNNQIQQEISSDISDKNQVQEMIDHKKDSQSTEEYKSNTDIPTSNKTIQLRFEELNQLFASKKVISLKGAITKYHQRTIKQFISNYNKKHPESETLLRLCQTNERYIIYKHPKSLGKDVTPSTEINLKPNEAFKPLSRHSRKLDPVDSGRETTTGRSAESGNSDPASDDEVNSLDHSSYSGSLDVNIQKTKKGSINLNSSERFEMSDEIDEIDEENTEGQTSIEILEGANSISEQTEEDDDDDEVMQTYKKSDQLTKLVQKFFQNNHAVQNGLHSYPLTVIL